MKSDFHALRTPPCHGDYGARAPRDEEWLLIEWFKGETEPTKCWLWTMPPNTLLPSLVRTAKLRWRIERDYEELKDEIGLDHSEGRGWRGFHNHATLCIAAYGCLTVERGPSFPLGRFAPRSSIYGRSPTRSLPSAGSSRSGRSGTSLSRSQRSESASRSSSSKRCLDAPAAIGRVSSHDEFALTVQHS